MGDFVILTILVYISLIYFTSAQLSSRENLITQTSCELFSVTIDCGTNNAIALQQVQYGYATRCNTQCCQTQESGDCLVTVTDSTYFKRGCSGQSSCTPPAVSSHDFCSFGRQLASYVTIEYYCIPKSRITSICSSTTITSAGEPLYLTNPGYPGATIGTRSCSCSYEAQSCSTGTSHFIIDADLYSEPSTCEQNVLITDVGGVLRESIKCESYYTTFVTQNNLLSNYYNIQFESNSSQILEGYLFIGFTASDSNVPFSLSCSSKSATMCIDCSSPPNVPNGNITATPGKTTYGETATVNCNTGYNSTKTSVSCNSSGTWDTAQCVIIDCGSPPNITNGNIAATPGKTTYGETATVKCNTGYNATKASVLCNSSGIWDTVQCVIKDCGLPPNITNGNIAATPGKTTYGNAATVNCNTGYHATQASVSCNSLGTWDTAQCIIKDCGSPPNVPNGYITATSGKTTYGETATVNCNTGFNATQASVSCNSSGTWDTAQCAIIDCGSPPNITHGTISATHMKTTYEETATVNCKTGYNATQPSVSCNSLGTWYTAHCIIKYCGSPPNVPNGYITVTSGKTIYGETATVNCYTGYNANQPSVSCNSLGTWESAECVIKDCGSPPNITNGNIAATPGKTTYWESATVNCITGYKSTKASVLCNSSGIWDTVQCVIKDCGLPQNITNGNIAATPGKTTYEETATINCITGYHATQASVSCNSLGTWDTAECIIKDCGSPPNVPNGYITATSGITIYGETATVNCNTGYNSTKASVSCNSSGTWDTAQCVIIDCGSPPNVTNGNLTATPGKTTYEETATVNCNTGYHATQPSVLCNSLGTWDSAQCVIKECGSPPNITNGNITATSGKTTYGKTATVNCNTGYIATQTSVLCNSLGIWDTVQCVIKDCGSLPNITNGNIAATPGKTTYGETATVNCNTGYTATQASVSCNSSGTWDKAQCVFKDLSTTANDNSKTVLTVALELVLGVACLIQTCVATCLYIKIYRAYNSDKGKAVWIILLSAIPFIGIAFIIRYHMKFYGNHALNSKTNLQSQELTIIIRNSADDHDTLSVGIARSSAKISNGNSKGVDETGIKNEAHDGTVEYDYIDLTMTIQKSAVPKSYKDERQTYIEFHDEKNIYERPERRKSDRHNTEFHSHHDSLFKDSDNTKVQGENHQKDFDKYKNFEIGNVHEDSNKNDNIGSGNRQKNSDNYKNLESCDIQQDFRNNKNLGSGNHQKDFDNYKNIESRDLNQDSDYYKNLESGNLQKDSHNYKTIESGKLLNDSDNYKNLENAYLQKDPDHYTKLQSSLQKDSDNYSNLQSSILQKDPDHYSNLQSGSLQKDTDHYTKLQSGSLQKDPNLYLNLQSGSLQKDPDHYTQLQSGSLQKDPDFYSKLQSGSLQKDPDQYTNL